MKTFKAPIFVSRSEPSLCKRHASSVNFQLDLLNKVSENEEDFVKCHKIKNYCKINIFK